MDHVVRTPEKLADEWRNAMGPLAVGEAIEHEGRVYIATMFDVSPVGRDVWTGRTIHIIGKYRRYVPPYVTAEELIEMHEKVKAHGLH